MTLTKRISLLIVSALFGVFNSVHQSATCISMENHRRKVQDSESEEPDVIDDSYDGFLDAIIDDATYKSDDDTHIEFYGSTTADFDSMLFRCSFDMESLYLENYYESQKCKVAECDSFYFEVDEGGKLDATLEYDVPSIGSVQQYQLSQYKDLKELEKLAFGETTEGDSSISLQSIGVTLLMIAALITIYVVVTESAEQIRAKQNYIFNQTLDNESDGMNEEYYIYNQRATETNYRNAGRYRFGFTTFDKTGCEVAAVYNMLISAGCNQPLSVVIHDFETWGIEFSVAWGSFGSNPNQIGKILSQYGFVYSRYSSPGAGLAGSSRRYRDYKRHVSVYSAAHLIVAKWNPSPLTEGLHTFYISMPEDDVFYMYNNDNEYGPEEIASLDELFPNGKGFIVGYITHA